MVEKHGMMADDEMGEGDFGWTWLIKAWTVLFHNVCVCFVVGKIDDDTFIIGKVEDTRTINGLIEDDVDIEGKIGCWS